MYAVLLGSQPAGGATDASDRQKALPSPVIVVHLPACASVPRSAQDRAPPDVPDPLVVLLQAKDTTVSMATKSSDLIDEDAIPTCQCDLRRRVRWNLCSKGRRIDFSHAEAVDKFSYA